LVQNLVGDLKPVHAVWPAWAQWLSWFAVAACVTVGALHYLKPQEDLTSVLGQIPHSAFLILVYAASALSAWGAIVTSLPGRTQGTAQKALTLALLAVVVAMPLLFFPRSPGHPGFLQLFHVCCGCVYVGAVVGIVPWLATGWMLSRNASFHPGWTGAWAGVSAFLLGLGVVQMHCSAWEMDHVMMGHILPVALMTGAATWAGTFWFSRWKR
jgi:hypothetical protein